MIKDFEVTNFRHFRNLRLKKLSRVNLFVGKNSAGKSALLEAMLLFFSKMSEKHLPAIHIARQETFDQKGWGEGKTPLRHLFFGHKLPCVGEQGIELKSSGDERSFELKVAAYTRELARTTEEFGSVYRFVELPDIDGLDPDIYETYVVASRGGQLIRVAQIDASLNDLRRRSRLPRRAESKIDSCIYIPTKGLDDEYTVQLWDAVSLTPLENEVVKGLKLIEPKVEAVAFVGADSPRDGRIPLVKISGISEPIPLKSLGDGISRIFQIIVSIVNSKDGALLIDEFENGLHWTVQEDVWDLVYKLSSDLNVQVFATTHSRDCINGFEAAWAKDAEGGAFARIIKTLDAVSVKEYELDLLQDSLVTDVEVR